MRESIAEMHSETSTISVAVLDQQSDSQRLHYLRFDLFDSDTVSWYGYSPIPNFTLPSYFGS